MVTLSKFRVRCRESRVIIVGRNSLISGDEIVILGGY